MTTPANAPAPKTCTTGRCTECGAAVSPHAPMAAPMTKNPALAAAQLRGLRAQRDEYARQLARLEAKQLINAAARRTSPSAPKPSLAERMRVSRTARPEPMTFAARERAKRVQP